MEDLPTGDSVMTHALAASLKYQENASRSVKHDVNAWILWCEGLKASRLTSANLTGAGLGAKGAHKRNFEAGFLTSDAGHTWETLDRIDQLYLGEFCLKCRRRSVCPDPIA
jgi:hypothetical protein